MPHHQSVHATGPEDTFSGHADASVQVAAVAAGYENEDPHVKPIVIFTVLLVLANVAVFYAMKWTNHAFMEAESGKDLNAHPLAAERTEPIGPRLQAQPSAEFTVYKAEQAAALSGYRWLDRTGGVVQLPVERALEIVSERGLPHRK